MRFADNVIAKFGTGGDLQIKHNATASSIENYVGDLTILNTSQDNDIVFKGDDGQANTAVATYFYLDGSSAAHDGSATTALYTNWPDNSYISLGTGHDLQLVHTGVNSVIQNLVGKLQITSYTDDIEIVQYADDKDIIFQSDNGTGGVQTYFFLDGSAEQVEFNKSALWTDNDYIKLGTDGDLQIYHNGSNSYIDQTGTGDLYIRNLNENRDIIFQSDDGTGGGNVETYFFLDGSASSGPFTTFLDSSKLAFGIERDLQIYHDGTKSVINNSTGNLEINNAHNDGDIIFKSDNGEGATTTYFSLDGSEAAHDGSATTALYTNWPDKSRISLGTSHDLQIWHEGSHSYIIDNGTGNLWIGSNGGSIYLGDEGASEIYLQANDNGSVSLYHDNSKSLKQQLLVQL